MKRRFGVISGLVLSLFHPGFYRDVARNWGGIGFVYLLLLFTLTWIPVLWKWQTDFTKVVQTDLPKAIKDVPEISVKNGKAFSTAPQPYIINDSDNNTPVIIFDTTGQIKNLDNSPAVILVTENELIIKDKNQVQTHKLSDFNAAFGDVELSKEMIQDKADAIARWLGTALFLPAMAGSLIRALILMLAAGVVGLIFKSSVNPRISFGSLVRMAAMGMTLPTYLLTAAMMTDFPVPGMWFFISLAITSAYVVLGAKWAWDPMDAEDRFDDRDRGMPPRDRPDYDRPGSDRPAADGPGSDAYRAEK